MSAEPRPAPLDGDLLQAIAAALDGELHEYYTTTGITDHDTDMGRLLRHLFGDPKAEQSLAPLIISRATMAAQVTSNEDLDERIGEVSRAIQGWLDGFLVGLRYAEQQALPKPEMRILDV